VDAVHAASRALIAVAAVHAVAAERDGAAEVELLRCDYAARCSRAGCRQYRATTIIRHVAARAARPLGSGLQQLVEQPPHRIGGFAQTLH
jgi:hypothetical protein